MLVSLRLMNIPSSEATRFFLWFPVGVGVGIYIYFGLSLEPLLCFFYSGLLTIFLVTGIIHRIWGEIPIVRLLCFILYSLALGSGCAKIRVDMLQTPLLQASIQNVSFEGVVDDIEDHPRKTQLQRVLISIKESCILLYRLKLTASKVQTYTIGERIRGRADLLPPSLPVTLGGMDWRMRSYFDGISATGRMTFSKTVAPPEPWVISKILGRIRYDLSKTIRKFLPGQPGAVATALVTGERATLTQETKKNFSDAGIAHILAISGLHVSLVIGMMFIAIRRTLACVPAIVLYHSIKRWAACSAIVATFFYVALAAFPYSALRAFGMASLMMLAILNKRHYISMRSVALAALVILLFFPEAIFSASFQLSFAAVIALIAGYEWTQSFVFYHTTWWKKLIFYAGSLMFSTFLATAATTPFTLAIFQRTTLQALLGNMVAIPLTSFWVMPCAVVCTLSCLWGGTSFFFKLWGYGLQAMIQTATYVAQLPGAAMTIPKPHPSFLPIFLMGGLWMAIWKSGQLRIYGFIPIFVSIGILLWANPIEPDIYMAGDGSVIAFRQNDTLYVSSEKKGLFHWQNWAQTSHIHDVKPWMSSVYKIHHALMVADPWRFHSYTSYLSDSDALVLSNGRLAVSSKHTIDRDVLHKRGSCFVWTTPRIKVRCIKDHRPQRPWL